MKACSNLCVISNKCRHRLLHLNENWKQLILFFIPVEIKSIWFIGEIHIYSNLEATLLISKRAVRKKNARKAKQWQCWCRVSRLMFVTFAGCQFDKWITSQKNVNKKNPLENHLILILRWKVWKRLQIIGAFCWLHWIFCCLREP